MNGRLPPHVFRRRGHRALRRMTERQRAIFWALRFEETDFSELAERYGIGTDEVQAEFTEALRILSRALRESEPWWRRLWPF